MKSKLSVIFKAVVSISGAALTASSHAQQVVVVTGERVRSVSVCFPSVSESCRPFGPGEDGFFEADIAYVAADTGRTEAACREEQIVKAGVEADLASNAVQFGTQRPLGTIIMSNAELDDPRYAGRLGGDPSWVKYQAIVRYGQTTNSAGVTERGYTVVLHYMFNLRTKQYEQIKFKNHPSHGCRSVGT